MRLLALSPRRWVVPLFFAGVLALGAALHRDYGVSWDEWTDRLNGMVNAKYVAERLAPELARRQENYHRIPDLRTFVEHDHGATFELPVVVLTKLAGAEDQQQIYQLRHLLTFLLYWVGMLAFYGLARLRFRDWRLALLGSALLWLTPRLFAESFYNAKDAAFLALFTLAMFALARLMRRPTLGRGLLHGVATGAAIALRVNGVLLVPLTLAGVLLAAWATPRARRQRLLSMGAWLLTAAGATVLFWPYLWESPVAHFVTAFRNLSRFSRWDGQVLYFSHFVRGTELPWHYAPVWILITTPVAYTLTFALGAGAWLRRYLPHLGRVLRTYAGWLDLLTWAWLLGPLVAVVLFRSVLYDGWRHLYFVYPAFLLLALQGVRALQLAHRQWQRRLVRRVALVGAGLLALGAAEPLARIVLDHPHQQVYFSLLPGRVVEQQFERDYWGLSYRKGLEWILAHDTAARIPVCARPLDPVYVNTLILSGADRQRLVLARDHQQARYFLTNYRNHPQPWPAEYGREVYAVWADGIKILSVLQRPVPRQ
ncbi:ArnT family glycosyltransferase [Hymenobacter latericus]|uniref:ArnT family glycosyltransferase n=1 Tax=Hymenobacter sp. YIM 151858-1 TaxID=2987688 RepID=UPI0022263AED|nr:glycosyltransferase family 39 protein [Hymenobacter sp. YIM 151858-1]UYZ58471.1 glycosyltransferase family 39 protein [Hymenobacter sp. YIM 151858-1]